MGGVGGGDVRGDGPTAAYRDNYGDECTNDVGAAVALLSTAAYRDKYNDERTNNVID